MGDVLIVIIGCSKGYGQAIVSHALSRGTFPMSDRPDAASRIKFLLLGKDVNGMSETRKKLQLQGAKDEIEIARLDLEDAPGKVDEIFRNSLERLNMAGVIDLYLFHNAGIISPCSYVYQHEPAEIVKSIQINFTSFCILQSSFFKWLHNFQITSTRGVRLQKIRIIQITSKAATDAFPSMTIYGSVKAARDAYMRTITAELQILPMYCSLDIKLLSWAPGPMETDMLEELKRSPYNTNYDIVKKMNVISTEESARRMWNVIREDLYQSAEHIDVFDDN